MIFESMPIEVFVVQSYATPEVQKIVENWRIEPDTVMAMVIEHFRELGLFAVPVPQQKVMKEAMITFIRTSPDLIKMLRKSEQEEAVRARSKHAD